MVKKNGKTFFLKVMQALKTIEPGHVMTYGACALAIGHPRAYRAVGSALKKNPYPIQVPCHRVIRGNGEVGGYVLGIKKKILLLKKEGVKFVGQTKVSKEYIL